VSRRTTPTRVGLAFVGAATVAALGFATGAAYSSPASPQALQPPATASTFPVSQTAFDDARPVALTASRDAATTLAAPVAGRVTRYDCAPGGEVVSGTSPLSVDGVPVLALATATPLWRDLSIGDAGEDVSALQHELTRLGHPVGASGKVDRATLRAFAAARTAAGAAAEPATQVPTVHVLWLPASTVAVEDCPAATGSTVEVGDEIATVPGTLTSVSIIDVPTDLLPGPRLLTVDGTGVPVDPAAPITDPAVLATLAGLPSLQPAGEETEPPTGRLALTDPIEVSVVPPASVVGDGILSCVVAAGRPHNVRVVGSELGQSFVVFESTAPKDVDTAPRGDVTCA
jgi:peptidoglycan hydrolase-like protein with peptidoglycan-binding domain